MATARSGSAARCHRDGHLVTLELDAHHAAVARENVAAAGLEAVAEVRQGPAMTSLDAMVAAGEGPFDLIFVDADKSGYPDYLSGALRLSRPGTLLIADNVVRRGRVVDAGAADPDVQGVRRFTDAPRRRAPGHRDRRADGRREGIRRLRDRHRGRVGSGSHPAGPGAGRRAPLPGGWRSEVAGASVQLPDRMGEDAEHGVERLDGPLQAARDAEHEAGAPDAAQGT